MEKLSWALFALVLGISGYGPSEISVVCTGGYVQSGDAITIGAQLPTYECHILDPETLEAGRRTQGLHGMPGILPSCAPCPPTEL